MAATFCRDTIKEARTRAPIRSAQSRRQRRMGRIERLLAGTELWVDWDGSLAKGAPNPPPSLRITPTI